MQERRSDVYRVVLTGGPCAGKTSSLALISDHFRNLGWNVYCSPEAATLLVNGGVSWAKLTPEQAFHFQKNVIKTMMLMEDSYMELAQQQTDGKPTILLCDRGVMDCSAYVDSETFDKLLQSLGINSVFEVKDNRYDMVIHLFSAAIGAEEHYILSNNNARTESAEQARIVDRQILNSWTGHPHIVCIDNRTIFKEKVLRAVQAICKRVGAPLLGTSTIKRRFQVTEINPTFYGIHNSESDCEYTYLIDGEYIQQRLRKRGSMGSYIYTLRSKTKLPLTEDLSENSRNISKREYDSFLLMALPNHVPIQTKKRSFVYNNHYFNLVTFQNIRPGLLILEIYEDRDVKIQFPEHITIGKEVTDDPNYSLFTISKKQ